jgi:hypothetical protein
MSFRVRLAICFTILAGCTPAQAMTFRIVAIDDPDWCGRKCPLGIAAEGLISRATPDEFEAFARAHVRDKNVLVLLNSDGGNVVASMRLGHTIRRIGANTAVAANSEGADGRAQFAAGRCFSACVYALMGGVKRVVPPGSFAGVRRMFADVPGGGLGLFQERRNDNGSMRELLESYAETMGVDRGLVASAESQQSADIRILTPQEIAQWRLGSNRF